MVELPPNQQRVAPGRWPLVGEKEPRRDDAPWTVTVTGLVARPQAFALEDLQALPQVERRVDIHCVTRWSKLDARFGGVTLAALLDLCRPLPEAQFLSFVARSERNHSTSLALNDALALDTLIALRYEDEPLPVLHGGPVRTIVPGRYFYKSLKWLERIEVLAMDRPGYWEAEAGYHNNADPWAEERYIAADIPYTVLKKALQVRDFRGLDLRGLQADDLDLTGLTAEGALLRDAHFERASLTRADFQRANLSNAHLAGADLREALLIRADVEGADFSGADLRGADFSDASLFGATFCAGRDEQGNFINGAILDRTTRFSPGQWDALTADQRAYLEAAVAPFRSVEESPYQ